MVKEFSEIALPQDLISAALIRGSKTTCEHNEIHELVDYIHDKYKDLPEDFIFKATLLKASTLSSFLEFTQKS